MRSSMAASTMDGNQWCRPAARLSIGPWSVVDGSYGRLSVCRSRRCRWIRCRLIAVGHRFSSEATFGTSIRSDVLRCRLQSTLIMRIPYACGIEAHIIFTSLFVINGDKLFAVWYSCYKNIDRDTASRLLSLRTMERTCSQLFPFLLLLFMQKPR